MDEWSTSDQKKTPVLIREDNVTSMEWPFEGVIHIHPGSNGVIRAATVKITKGILDRNVKRLLSLLYMPDDAEPPITQTTASS